MGTTGLIFAAIAIAWLAYLVPHFVRRRGDEPAVESDPAGRFSDSVRVVQHGTAPLLDQDLQPISEYEVSTPLTRRAAVAELRRLDRLAAARRRRVLLVLLAVTSAVIGVCAIGWLPWWSTAVSAGLLLLFVVVARLSERAQRRSLDARYRAIVGGSTEKTVFLSRKEMARATVREADKAGSEPAPGRLWDPLPITKPTYVSKPLVPRTVRTIDLSGPDPSTFVRPGLPVTADAPPAPERTRGDVPAEEGRDDGRAASA